MAQFANPFVGVVPEKKLTRDELIRAIRQNVGAEEEAVHLYTAIADATDNPVAQKILREVANDEKVHSGNFLRLIEMLNGDEGKYLLQGAIEADEDTAALRTAQWVSSNFNPLDPLGIIGSIRDEVKKLRAGVSAANLPEAGGR